MSSIVDKVPIIENVSIGSTLDDRLAPSASPFSPESLEEFVKAMEDMKCDEGAYGTVKFEETLIEDQTDMSKYLGVDGALSLTYGPISGNAKIHFAMNNVASDLDITLLIKATHIGEYKAANEVLLNKLKLKDFIADGISKELTQEEFTRKYGKYLIIGIEKGGEMLFTQTIKAKNKDDKMKAGGSLKVKLNQTGFSVEGSVEGEFKDENYSNQVDIATTKSFKPNCNDELVTTVIGQLEKLTNPNISKNDDFIKNHGSLKGEIEKNLQKYFAKQSEAVYYVVKELEHISCVADAFNDKPGNWDGAKINAFCFFSNELFVILRWMQNTIKRYEEQMSLLDLSKKADKELSDLKRLYESQLEIKVAAMKIVDRKELYDNANAYNELIKLRNRGESKEDNDAKEICKPFVQIKRSDLKEQFNMDIKAPFEARSQLLLSKQNEPEQKLKLFWVFGNELHSKLAVMKYKIEDYGTRVGALNLNDENDKKLNDNISKWQTQVTKKILHLSSIGEKQVGEEADNYYKAVNDEKNDNKKKDNDNKGEIEKNWVEINIAKLEKEFEEEIVIPSQKRLPTDDDQKMMEDKWVDLDLLPCHVANAMMNKEVNCRSLDDLQKLSKIRSQNCILNLMNASLSLTPLSSNCSSQLAKKRVTVLSVKSGLAIGQAENTKPGSAISYALQLCKESDSQPWGLAPSPDGYLGVYYFNASGKDVVDCEWIGFDENLQGTPGGQFLLLNSFGLLDDSQKFRFDKMNNYKVDNKDVFMIINKKSGKAIGVNGKHVEGAKISLSRPNGNNDQLFTLIEH